MVYHAKILLVFLITASTVLAQTPTPSSQENPQNKNRMFSNETDKAWVDFQKKITPEEATSPELSDDPYGNQLFIDESDVTKREKDQFLKNYWSHQRAKQAIKKEEEQFQAPDIDQ